jgi:hypothetical protein
MTEYRRVGLPKPFQHGGIVISSLDFAVGQQLAEAAVVHVRGLCADGIPFAGCITICEGREAPPYDLRTFGAPLDLAELAIAIELLLAGSSPLVSDEMRRICEWEGNEQQQGGR